MATRSSASNVRWVRRGSTLRPALALGALLAVATTGSCSCGDESTDSSLTGGSGGVGGGGLTGGSGLTGGDGSGGELLPGCASGILCGTGDCCDEAEECVLGQCLPECASQVRCGAALDICCEATEVCLGGQCATPGAACVDWADCDADEFCEPTLGQCLPQPSGSDLCEYLPPVGPLTPAVEWSWTSSPIHPAHVQVINMPVVVNLDLDATPDVVIVTSDNYSGTGVGYLRALNGHDGSEKWNAAVDVYQDAYRVNPRGTPAAADIDSDGFVEIVTPKAGGGLIAFEHDGSFKWSTTQTNGITPWTTSMASATVSIADLEGDGAAEIVVGGVVFEADGTLRFDHGVYSGSNNGSYGAVSIIADLDEGQNNGQEIVTGRRAWRADGTLYWDNGLVDGYPAIGDLDLDGDPELVIIANNTIRIQDPTDGTVRASLALPAAGDGGPPTIANFDGDPEPEMASANGGAYAVFDYSPTPPTVTLKWSQTTQDLSSNRTGSSVFDFQGDGAAEVVYGDECYFRVYRGADGLVLYEVENSSATIHEYPVVVDVDGDNNTEVVVTANDLNHINLSTTCPYGVANARHGVFVFGDQNDNWVRTRRLWNQHAYHIVNINGNGSLPLPEPPSWVVPPGFNNYRQSNQGEGVFNAPDLQVSLEVSLAPCPTEIELRAVVQNNGSLGVAAGIPVSFYEGTDATGTFIATEYTQTALLPGQFEVVTVDYSVANQSDLSFFVVVDADQSGDGLENECLEDNNESSISGVSCPGVN
ncbi:MAG: VCBS repeat-containing protein [Deltaproteobacteria bacterium]|jgi:hypothetical protein|nr:VCBS repeat-containing protein [Deltaproteobacteria bacterium]MBW2531721.1 VCBS repeat-containing protein [Deltaproteobacteria bacterium]